MRSDELAAAALLAELLNREAVPHDRPGSKEGRHDWDLRAPDGTTIAVEVTMHTDPEMVEFWIKGPHFREFPNLGGTYLVNVWPRANRNALWRTLPNVLAEHGAELVDADLENTRWHRPSGHRSPVEALVLSLGVRHVYFAPAPARSAITFTTSGSGWIATEVAVEAALSELEPNRTKLAAAVDADERHLFVWINGSAALAHGSLRDSDPPSEAAPDLGSGIDVLWVAALDARRRPVTASVLWRATSRRRWEDWTPKLSRRNS